ncbi:Uncharacterized protein TCM_042254 [Theobroma cacao]|uniref:NFD4 C-terminal domain-containing protein n=1 Tax=Theobroma cacao TaxID=3641 RepID=A0A061H0E7_THECC|nr:Uncharacterized protein TCM_042254 [Theobroma cacao]
MVPTRGAFFLLVNTTNLSLYISTAIIGACTQEQSLPFPYLLTTAFSCLIPGPSPDALDLQMAQARAVTSPIVLRNSDPLHVGASQVKMQQGNPLCGP